MLVLIYPIISMDVKVIHLTTVPLPIAAFTNMD